MVGWFIGGHFRRFIIGMSSMFFHNFRYCALFGEKLSAPRDLPCHRCCMKLAFFCCLLIGSFGLANLRAQDAKQPEEKKPMDSPAKEVAVLKTSAGTAFHRIIKGFMIQGGDPNTKDPSKESSYGIGGPGYSVPAEFNDRPHVRGVLSMARSADPNSAGSQFFICLGTKSSLDHQYTTFGTLIKGLDVLDKIGDTPVVRSPMGEMSKPSTRVALESVKIVPADSVK